MTTSSDDLSIKLPKGAIEGVVNAHIHAAVFEALGKDPDRLIAAVVSKAMSAKKDHYNRTTIFEDTISQEIRDVALEEFKRWLEENRPKIRDQIRAKLKTLKLAKMICEGLTQNIVVSVDIKAGYDG